MSPKTPLGRDARAQTGRNKKTHRGPRAWEDGDPAQIHQRKIGKAYRNVLAISHEKKKRSAEELHQQMRRVYACSRISLAGLPEPESVDTQRNAYFEMTLI